MDYSDIIKNLKSLKNEKNIDGMARFGITGKKVLGISIYVLRDFAKKLGKNHELALKLWKSGFHEARHLAVFTEELDKVTPEQMNDWVNDFEAWDDTDQACTSLFDKTPHAWSKVKEWSKSDKEFVKRAAFSLLAGLATHDKTAKDEQFIQLFPVIKKASTDERNFVKKAVNWALRNIGKRNKNLNKRAVEFSKKLLKSNSKSAKWIASDAIRELSSEKVQKRL
ncbi:MAG: DNA alkylation repair protein [Nanoarchaeota archaeon]|nr:DNA alkylation repair protein [Nanoarchaeota archaeon]